MSEQGESQSAGESRKLTTVEKVTIYTEMAQQGATNAEIAKRLDTTPASLSVWASNMRKQLKAKKGIDLPRPKASRSRSTLDDVANAVQSITGQLDNAEAEAAEQTGDENADVQLEQEAEATA